ncbi:SDR family oxidoreductase [Candidatus Poriferisocius sp.]|uniref:SDR family oxidoreductase n=1 Tax=Candidatus Poriferisocius sp. TaxID=3101276 RepID=UPI003B025D73
MKTYAITGAASGIGAACASELIDHGHRVIGVDIQQTDIVCDLSKPDGRRQAVDEILEACDGTLDGIITSAGLSSLPSRPGSLIVSVNYFGTVELLTGLREGLARSDAGAAVAISSNSVTTTPGVPLAVTEACLAHDEERACALADELEMGPIITYPATKTAVARWVRRNAPTVEWIGEGITLNAIAPGKIDTPMIAEALADPIVGPGAAAWPVPAGRSGRPEEIAHLAAFLLSAQARFFVGSLIYCDGGTDAEARADDWPVPNPHEWPPKDP